MQITSTDKSGFLLKADTATVSLCEATPTAEAQIIITRTADEKLKAARDQAVFDWPGEYEARGVMTMLIPVGQTGARVTKVILDGISVVHLGELSAPLSDAEESKVGKVDILLAPVGATAKISAKDLQGVVESLDPRIVVPMLGDEVEVQAFAKQLNFPEALAEDTLKLKSSDLAGEKTTLRVLRPRK
jgi:L-ascorbate metabolism protein UlaG (beta-lactamase superfamily)